MGNICIGDWTQLNLVDVETLNRELNENLDPANWYEIVDIYINSSFEPVIVAKIEGKEIHLDLNEISLTCSKEKYEKKFKK